MDKKEVPEEAIVERELYRRPSRMGSFFSVKKNHDLPLQPRLLARKSRRRKILARTLVPIVGFALISVLSFFGVYWFISGPAGAGECDEVTTTGLASYFLINIRLGQRFTYMDARLIDLAWGIVVGQGGRFLHGWILYYYVISPNITKIMERRAVPYEMYADLSFDTSSLQSLWTIFRSFGKVRGSRSIASMIWYIFAIGYVLSFSALWDASTGYLNPTMRYYRMPDGSYITPQQIDLLSYCWSQTDPRLSGLIPEIVQSPSLQEINSTSYEHIEYISPTPSTGWLRSMPLPGEAPSDMAYYSSDFAALYYSSKDSLTQAELQSFLTARPYRWGLQDSIIEGPLNSSTLDMMINATALVERGPYIGQRWFQIHAWLYSIPTSDIESTSKLLGSSWGTLQDSSSAAHWAYDTTNSTGWPANFMYNNSITPRSGVVPYNSSITINGTMHALPAPFVRLGQKCYRLQGLGNPCLCYRGTPIPYPLDDEVVICVAESGYVWGFSGKMLSISLLLECMWAIGCFGVWMDAHVNSELENMQRSSAGAVRTACDLAEAARKVLGDDISTYSNQELRDALEKCEPVGFEWDDDGEGTAVRLVERESRVRKRKNAIAEPEAVTDEAVGDAPEKK